MARYRRASHVTYDCRYHIVWIPKYRREIFKNEEFKKRTEELIREISKELYVKIIELGIEKDHVHLYASIPVSQPIPYVLQKFKGITSKILRKEFKLYLANFYWKSALWATGYFVATVGEVNHETIKRYVKMQGKKDVLGKNKIVNL